MLWLSILQIILVFYLKHKNYIELKEIKSIKQNAGKRTNVQLSDGACTEQIALNAWKMDERKVSLLYLETSRNGYLDKLNAHCF